MNFLHSIIIISHLFASWYDKTTYKQYSHFQGLSSNLQLLLDCSVCCPLPYIFLHLKVFKISLTYFDLNTKNVTHSYF